MTCVFSIQDPQKPCTYDTGMSGTCSHARGFNEVPKRVLWGGGGVSSSESSGAALGPGDALRQWNAGRRGQPVLLSAPVNAHPAPPWGHAGATSLTGPDHPGPHQAGASAAESGQLHSKPRFGPLPLHRDPSEDGK